jgi:uncharacterized alpha-E superfamily protein
VLAALDPGPSRSGMGDVARRPIGRLRARLEYTDPKLLTDQLPELLVSLQRTCREASEAITERYFKYEQPVTWEQEG